MGFEKQFGLDLRRGPLNCVGIVNGLPHGQHGIPEGKGILFLWVVNQIERVVLNFRQNLVDLAFDLCFVCYLVL